MLWDGGLGCFTTYVQSTESMSDCFLAFGLVQELVCVVAVCLQDLVDKQALCAA